MIEALLFYFATKKTPRVNFCLHKKQNARKYDKSVKYDQFVNYLNEGTKPNPPPLATIIFSLQRPSSVGTCNICARVGGMSADQNLTDCFASCENIVWISFKRMYGKLLPPPCLVYCFNYAYKKGEMSVSQRRGVIALVPKEDSNLLSLSNWRPITLLNLDYKTASKVIAKRMEKVLSVLINPDQTGFVKGRYMGQNIRLVNDILEQTKLESIPGILLQLDFCKAFDTIEWSFIYKVIALLNFGGSMQRWISTFYSNSESAVLNNGFCTNYFKLSRGCDKGSHCPLICLL